MKDSVRRIVMLCTILTFGLILIFIDITLIQLFFMMVVLAILLPFLLGIATVAEVRTALQNMKKTGILKRLDKMKFSKSPKDKKVPPKPDKAPQKPQKKEARKTADTSGGFGTHLKSIISSFGSLGTLLKERSRREKKVEDIYKILDKTVSEKVTRSPAPSETVSAGGGSASLPADGGAGSIDDTDPFLSLSSDEFDAGLLDGLDDDLAQPGPLAALEPGGESASSLPEPELLMPSLDSGGESPGAPADAASGLDGLSGLGGDGSMDTEFGDLENLNLDDIELDDDMDESATPAAATTETSGSVAPAPAAAPPAESSAVKTAWIASDAPKVQIDDQLGVQSDMASFAGGASGTDEDLLSSIASDVKHVRKEVDISLVRELKDFRAPASEIEHELQDMYQNIGGGVPKTKDKNSPPPEGIK